MSGVLDTLKQWSGTLYDAQTGRYQVFVKTNLGPELKLWDGTRNPTGKPGLAQLLGIKASIIVKDSSGRIVYVQGEPPKTNLILSGALLAGASYLAYLLWRGATARRK